MFASLARTTAWEFRGLPNAMRWLVHLCAVYEHPLRGGRAVDVLETLLDDHALSGDALGDDHPSLVVLFHHVMNSLEYPSTSPVVQHINATHEVRQNHTHTLALLTQRIRHRHPNLVECDIRSPRCCAVRRFDRLRVHRVTVVTGYEDRGVSTSTLGATASGEVVRESPVRDPLLRP
jgi:hypothetical protein